MPFKFHASRRHHIPRAKYRVMNWPDYDRGLVRRGDIRFWIDESALEQWDAAKRRTPGGQRRFSELAISTTLMLGVVFRLPLRQTEGFVRSLVDLMGCELPVPDHTTPRCRGGGERWMSLWKPARTSGLRISCWIPRA